MSKKKLGTRGSSLVEMVVAIALFGIVCIPLFGVFAGAATLLKKSKENIEISSVERQIKTEVVSAAKNSGDKLYPYNLIASEKSETLPDGTEPDRTKKNYGIITMENNKIYFKYKYSIKYLDNSDPNDKMYITSNGSADNAPVEVKRYRVDIFMIKSLELDTAIDDNFKVVKSFFIEV